MWTKIPNLNQRTQVYITVFISIMNGMKNGLHFYTLLKIKTVYHMYVQILGSKEKQYLEEIFFVF